MGTYMRKIQITQNENGRWICWTARALGLALSVFWLITTILVLFALEEPLTGQAVVLLILANVTSLGLLLAWRWEQIGGWITVVSGSVLGVATVYYHPKPKSLALILVFQFALPFFVPGLLFLVCSRGSKISVPVATATVGLGSRRMQYIIASILVLIVLLSITVSLSLGIRDDIVR